MKKVYFLLILFSSIYLSGQYHKIDSLESLLPHSKKAEKINLLNQLAKNYGSIPAHTELAAGWVGEMQADFPDVDFEVFLKSAEYPDQPNHESWIPDYTRISDAIDAAWELVSSGENLNVPEVLDSLNAECQGYLDEWWTVWG